MFPITWHYNVQSNKVIVIKERQIKYNKGKILNSIYFDSTLFLPQLPQNLPIFEPSQLQVIAQQQQKTQSKDKNIKP